MEKIVIGAAVIGGLAVYGFYYLLTQKKDNSEGKSEFIKTEKYDILKFSDVMVLSKSLVKDNRILENQKLVIVKVNKDYIITFYDETSSKIIDEKTIKIQCNSIDESLRLAFGDKGMLVIEE